MDLHYSNEPVVEIYRWAFLRMDYFYWKPEFVNKQLGTDYARQAVLDLGAWGSDALFGLLWRYSFDFTQSLRATVTSNPAIVLPNDTQSHLSMAVHSRHVNGNDPGCNVTLEQQGILDIMEQHQQRYNMQQGTPLPCQVALLSDRSCTLESLRECLEQTVGCTAVVMQHEVIQTIVREHGPFSRAGFFQDMLLAGLTARDGMVGTLEPMDGDRWRSSSELVEESIAYHRVMETFVAGQDPAALPRLLWSTLVRIGHATHDAR